MNVSNLARNTWELMTEGYAETVAAIAAHPNVVFWVLFSMLAFVIASVL